MAQTSTRQQERHAQPAQSAGAVVTADQFVNTVFGEGRRELIGKSMPKHVNKERFERNLSIALVQHPKLLECNPLDVFNEICKAAALGLFLDPQLGEAYLITGWNARERRLVPQLRIGYRGLIKLARQSGDVKSIYAHEICENDIYDISQGTEKRLVHKIDPKTDRGSPFCFYAVAILDDGTADFDVMSNDEIYAIRDRSDGWKAFQSGNIKSTPWSTDEGEMAKKTVLRRLQKRLPQSPDVAEAFRIEDRAEGIVDLAARARDITPAVVTLPPAPPPPPPEDDFPSAAAAPACSQANVRAPSSPEHTADRRAASSSQEQPATHPASFDDVLKLADQILSKVSDQPALHEAWQRFWKEGPMKWKEVAKGDQARAMEVLSKHKARLAKTGEVQVPDAGFTITKLVTELDAALAKCRDRASLSDTYTKIVQPLIEAGTVTDEHVNGPLGVVFTQHAERIEEIEDVPMEEPPPAEEDDGFPGDR